MTEAPKPPRGFQPGQSGNPAGKPLGARNRVLIALDAIGTDNAETILRATIAAAIGNEKTAPDLRAAELILSRVWPARRGRPVAIDLPAINAASDLPAALGALVAAVADGSLTIDEAQGFAAILETQRRAIETVELEARLTALEALKND